jgi:hypothetical protein
VLERPQRSVQEFDRPSLRPFLTLTDLHPHSLTFGQPNQPAALERRRMNEYILPSDILSSADRVKRESSEMGNTFFHSKLLDASPFIPLLFPRPFDNAVRLVRRGRHPRITLDEEKKRYLNEIVGSQHHGSVVLTLLTKEFKRCSLFN